MQTVSHKSYWEVSVTGDETLILLRPGGMLKNLEPEAIEVRAFEEGTLIRIPKTLENVLFGQDPTHVADLALLHTLS